MKMIRHLFTKYKYILLILVISLFAVLDLANFGIPPTHDGEYHVLRFQQFYEALSSGSIYPRWAPDFNNGYGIPLFNYVYPLPNYAASFFHFLGFGFINSFKLSMIVASTIGAIFMFLWTKKYWGNLGGIVSSVFYTYSPYHLLDIYVRGSVGEVWSLGLAPGLYWSYLNYFESKKNIYFVLSVIFLSLLILAHNILALVFFTFFIFYGGFLISQSNTKIKELKNLLVIIFSGIGITAFFWLPALLETKYVVGLQVFDPTKHFPVIYKLIYSSWGYGFSGSSVVDQMSFQIGLANLIIIVGSFIALYLAKNKRIFLFFLSIFFVTIFLITPFSAYLWKNVPVMSYIQFPWRLLSILILTSSFLSGSLVMDSIFKKRKRLQIFLALLLIFISISFSINYIKAPFYHERYDQHYFTRSNFTDGTNSPGNSFNTIWFNSSLEKSDGLMDLDQDEYIVILNKTEKKVLKVDINEKKTVKANIAYFPGWEVKVNNKKVPTKITKNGLIGFELPKNESIIEISLMATLVRKVALFISILSLVFLGLFTYVKSNTIKK